MNKYRIVKETRGDGLVSFHVQMKDIQLDYSVWDKIAGPFEHIETAAKELQIIKGRDIVETVVVGGFE